MASRVTCSKTLGQLCTRVEGKIVESTFFHLAMSLCQDTSQEVRASMCDQLAAIARAVGIELSKKYVFPELMELLKDEELLVRTSAYDCFTSLLDFYDMDTKNATIIPFVKNFLKDPSAEHLPMIAKNFGMVVHNVYSTQKRIVYLLLC